MKRILLVMLAIVFSFTLTGVAMAKGIKAPKEICLAAGSGDAYLCLATKFSRSIKFAEKQKVKYYAIDGSFVLDGDHYPIGGAGYVSGNLFLFHVNGQFLGMGFTDQSIGGFVDLSMEPAEGSITVIFTEEAIATSEIVHSLTAVPCTSIDQPSVPVFSIPLPGASAGYMYKQ